MLDEDAFGQGVDRAEHPAVLTLAEQLDRPVMLEQGAGTGVKAVVCGCELQNPGELLQDHDQLEQVLVRVGRGLDFAVQPARDRARTDVEKPRDVDPVEASSGHGPFQSLR
jgi:hypothetical protein